MEVIISPGCPAIFVSFFLVLVWRMNALTLWLRAALEYWQTSWNWITS
jgi:hypothetical protein